MGPALEAILHFFSHAIIDWLALNYSKKELMRRVLLRLERKRREPTANKLNILLFFMHRLKAKFTIFFSERSSSKIRIY